MFVRRAVEADLPRLMPMCRAFHAESPVHGPLPFDDQKVGILILDVLENPNWLAAVVCGDEGGIVGMLLVYCQASFFGPALEVGDLTFYVEPEKRGTRAAFLMMNELVAWAKMKGAVRIRLGISTGIHPEKTERFFARFGFERIGLLTQCIISPSD